MISEEEKKRLQALAEADRLEKDRLEEEKKQAALLAAQSDIKPEVIVDEEEAKYKSDANNDSWKKIVKAYKEETKQEPDEDGCLKFGSRNDAISFFEKQASDNLDFLVTEVSANRQPTGFYLYSCATNQLFKGSFEEIKKQMGDALEKDPTNSKLLQGMERIQSRIDAEANPTSKWRGAMESLKTPRPEPTAKKEDQKENEDEDEEQATRSTSPSPFSKIPKPKGI